MNTPVVVPPSARQLVIGNGVVPQQVPRAEITGGFPREVTFAPRVAPLEVMFVTVGEVTVGTALAAQTAPFQVVPPVQVAVAVFWSSGIALL